jgi:hypothetical protein
VERNVPVTVKLTRKFYETFGEEIANELVDLLNSVDASYRSELRELNEHNFQRFDAKLEQLRAELSRDLARLESRLTWRMFAFWAPTALAVIGSGAGVISLLLRR